jgi:hypothetical protein
MSYRYGRSNSRWKHGKTTLRKKALEIIRSGHGLRGEGLKEWYRRIREWSEEPPVERNKLRDLIERQYRRRK